MTKDPAFLLYYKDFDGRTANWEPEALGWYMRLWFFQAGNGYIPSNIEEIAQIARVRFSEYEKFKRLWDERISDEFSVTLSDTLKLHDKTLTDLQRDRRNNAIKKSVLAVFGNFIKSNELSVYELKFIKKTFREKNDFESINDNDERKKKILEFLEKEISDYRQRDAKRTHYANEDAIVNKDIDEIKDEKPKKSKIELPYETETFQKKWLEWKEYKAKEHGFKYRSEISERTALKRLDEISANEQQAIKIIEKSIANGWEGLFALKSKNNAQEKPDPRFNYDKNKFAGGSQRQGKVKFT